MRKCRSNKVSDNTNESKFDFQMKPNSRIIQVSAMKNFGKGGFFSLVTAGLGEDGVDIFRYGDPEMTSNFQSQAGNFVVSFSRDVRSFARIKNESIGEQFLPNFTQTKSSPGSYVEKGAQYE